MSSTDDRPDVPGTPDAGEISSVAGPSVVSIDDDVVIRMGLPLLLPDAGFVGHFDSVEAFLDQPVECDVVLLDLELDAVSRGGRLQGARAVREVSASGRAVLIYSSEGRREVLATCLAAGARGVVSKSGELSALAEAIRAVAAGQVVVPQSLVSLIEVAQRRGELNQLTARQREILSARARGESFEGIGERLHISRRTAEDHWAHVTRKYSEFLAEHSAADLERHLGLGPGDLVDGYDPR